MKLMPVRLLKGSSIATNHSLMCITPHHTTIVNRKVVWIKQCYCRNLEKTNRSIPMSF